MIRLVVSVFVVVLQRLFFDSRLVDSADTSFILQTFPIVHEVASIGGNFDDESYRGATWTYPIL